MRNWQPFAVAVACVLLLVAYVALEGTKPQPEYKAYPAAKKTSMPQPDYRGMPLEQAIEERRSVREYSGAPLGISQLSQLLYAAQGITHRDGFRAAPSAGGLYPLETYVFANRVEGLGRGMYHYNIREHTLELLGEGDFSGELCNASFGQLHVREAAAVVVFAAVENRTVQKYGEAGRKFIYIEAGHASQNLLLEAVSLGLGAVPVGGFEQQKMDLLLGLDGTGQYVVYMNAVGGKRG